MPPESGAPEDDLRRVTDANARFLLAIESLSDGDVRRPINLEGWSRGTC